MRRAPPPPAAPCATQPPNMSPAQRGAVRSASITAASFDRAGVTDGCEVSITMSACARLAASGSCWHAARRAWLVSSRAAPVSGAPLTAEPQLTIMTTLSPAGKTWKLHLGTSARGAQAEHDIFSERWSACAPKHPLLYHKVHPL